VPAPAHGNPLNFAADFVTKDVAMQKRRILVILGSDSDLPECRRGLEALEAAAEHEDIEVAGVLTMSVHRNTLPLFRELERLHQENAVDLIITGAGWANHLTGMVDAYLRYTLGNDRIAVFGVGFEDKQNAKHTQAAELSMSEVPGTQVSFGDGMGSYIGEDGFFRACRNAITGPLPTIKAATPRPLKRRTLEEAIAGREPAAT
jgi:phosphoribosylcarboxyaminoimidazole (NCAIR) mutase